MVIADGIPQRRIALDQATRNLNRFIRGIIEHLDVEFLPWIVQLADRLQQAFHDVLLVENRQLHGNSRQFLKSRRRLGRAILPVLVIQIDEDVPVPSIPGKQDQNNEIRDQQGQVESIRVIETAKRRVEKVLPDIRSNTPRPANGGPVHGRHEIRNQAGSRTKLIFYLNATNSVASITYLSYK